MGNETADAQTTDLEIRLASFQLERMRAMQYSYHRKFFHILFISSGAFAPHWILLWSAVALAALIYGLPVLTAPWSVLYLVGVALWAGGNVGYLVWFFIMAGDRKRMDDFLAENLGKPASENS